MRKYISKGKKKNKDEWVEGDYLFNDKPIQNPIKLNGL